MPIKVLFDGWPLIYQMTSPAAMHLLEILELLPAEIQASVALPAERPDWLPSKVMICTRATSNSRRNRLAWEQLSLPGLAQELGAMLLHLTSATAPLFARIPILISPAGEYPKDGRSGLTENLRAALGMGGMARRGEVLWPVDFPETNLQGVALIRLAPVVHPGFFIPPARDDLPDYPLPESYILYHGLLNPAAIELLLQVWGWVSNAIGSSYPLAVLGIGETGVQEISKRAHQLGLSETITILPAVAPGYLPVIYQRCTALFHPAPPVGWGDPLRYALACGKPVVGTISMNAAAVVGPAAYLVPAGDVRALGAALVSVVVDEKLAGELSEKASQRALSWRGDDFIRGLVEIYQRIGNSI